VQLLNKKKLVSKVNDIFNEADINKDGVLSLDEFTNIINKYKRKYPQLEEYSKRIKKSFEDADKNKDQKLSLDEFQLLIKNIDEKLKSLPATAQVASQEGRYLGKLFNKMIEKEKNTFEPFIYHHMGALAYVGEDAAVADLPKGLVFSGFGAWWLWRSIYLSKQVSFKNKFLVSFDWLKTLIFGRDITRN
jgi:uncharacterized protein YggL (DUF469 family)